MAEKPIEEVLYEALFGVPPVPGFSFEPVVLCFQEAVMKARAEERQAILDGFLAARPSKKGKHWNAGFDAAFMALNSIITDRERAEYPQAE